MTAWNLFPAVILNTLTFIMGAEPIDLKRTTTELGQFLLNEQSGQASMVDENATGDFQVSSRPKGNDRWPDIMMMAE